MIKPQLAKDAILDKVIFPCGVQPKIDGVRALDINRCLTGRSLDPFEGYGITDYFTGLFPGGDGEMTLGSKPNCTNRLCSMTTGAMGRFNGVTEMADLTWWIFDRITEETINLPYAERHDKVIWGVTALNHPRIKYVPMIVVNNRDELDAAIAELFADGYEGAIIRNLNAKYKEGRATLKRQELWRVKPWGDFEILVTGITEGNENWNEKTTNSLGRSERSSAQAGMKPNGEVGSIQGTLVKDFHSPITGELLFKAGLAITAGSGEMSKAEAAAYFQNPSTIVGHYAKIKTMTHGVKDLPRFPTFVSLRLKQDM
jgi:DNA ligase-1